MLSAKVARQWELVLLRKSLPNHWPIVIRKKTRREAGFLSERTIRYTFCMSQEGEPRPERIRIANTLEGALRNLKLLRPDSYKNYSVKERKFGDTMGVQIIIGENSIISEREDKSYEIFPRVNKETIQDLFGYYPDEVCRYLTLEQALNIADAAEETKRDPNKLLELKKTIDECYPDGFPEGPLGMFAMLGSAPESNNPEEMVNKIRKQFIRHIEEPRRKKEAEEED